MNSVRVAIYARYSTEMQSKHSADDQIRECTEYADRMGWAVVLTERDEAVRAGSMAGREGYARLLAAAKRHAFDVLLVFKVSRFSRSFLGGMTELAKLTELKVKIADPSLGIVDLETPAGQMMAAVHLMQAQQEVRVLGDNSKRGIKGQVLKGFGSGGPPAYGHKREPKFSDTERDVDGRPKRIGVPHVFDPVTGPIVQRIFRSYADGAGKSEIARALNADGIPSRDAGKSRNVGPQGGKIENSGTWNDTGIGAILANKVYIGTRIYGRYSRTGKMLPSGKRALVENPPEVWTTVENWCAPIIERELWDRVQARLAADTAEYHRTHTAKVHRQYLLSGFIRCGVCGRSYIIGSMLKGVRQYRCGMHTRGNEACSNRKHVPQEALEARVRHVLDALTKDPDKLQALVAEHNARVGEFNGQQMGAVRRLEGQLAKAKDAMVEIIKAIEAGAGAALKSLVGKLAEREAEAEELTAQIDKAKADLQPYLLPRTRAVQDIVFGRESVFAGDYEADRAFLDRCLESIVVHADGTIVMHFRKDSLFAPVAAYEMLPDGQQPEIGADDFTADGYRSVEEQRAMYALMAFSGPMPTRLVAFDADKIVGKYDPVRVEKTSGVPSEI